MKYADDPTKSAEFLRLALPLMSKQSAGLHPVSYSIWYEYVSGINPGLKSALDEILKRQGKLDEESTHELFRKHVAEVDTETLQRISSSFQELLNEMNNSASQAGEQAGNFDATLSHFNARLDPANPGGALQSADIGALLSSTRSMQSSVSALKAHLEQSRREAEELREEVSRARQDALTDALTGLTNRKGFDQIITQALAQHDPASKGLSLLICDVDHFKKINDTYGHVFGDKVLQSVGFILRQNVKGKDVAARFGGEEFTILLPDTHLDGARAVAEALRATLEAARIKRSNSNETVARVTMSFGVATHRPSESVSDLIARADAALYQSKERGRNRVTIETAG